MRPWTDAVRRGRVQGRHPPPAHRPIRPAIDAPSTCPPSSDPSVDRPKMGVRIRVRVRMPVPMAYPAGLPHRPSTRRPPPARPFRRTASHQPRLHVARHTQQKSGTNPAPGQAFAHRGPRIPPRPAAHRPSSLVPGSRPPGRHAPCTMRHASCAMRHASCARLILIWSPRPRSPGTGPLHRGSCPCPERRSSWGHQPPAPVCPSLRRGGL